MWFTKIAAQAVNDFITRVGSREGNGCDLAFNSGPLLFKSESDPDAEELSPM
jgi:hypothetical protein